MAKRKQRFEGLIPVSSKACLDEISVTEIFDTKYRDYAIYSAYDRAIPHIMDGLRPAQRKILYAALVTMDESHHQKFANLVGETYKKSNYSHGPASLDGGIVGFGAAFIDNINPIHIGGSGGTLREPIAAAARYLTVRNSPYSRIYKHHSHIWEHRIDSGEAYEPKFLLPIIPTLLCKRFNAIGLGYNTYNDVSFSLESVIDLCIEYLNEHTTNTELIPQVKQFDGTFSMVGERYKSSANYKILGSSIYVYGLPVNMTFAAFEYKMNVMADKGHIIEYDNNTNKKGTEYVIHADKEFLTKCARRNLHERIFGLSEIHRLPVLTVIGVNGKIKRYSTYKELTRDFVDYRLKLYDVHKKYMSKKLKEDIEHLQSMQRFIEAVVSGNLEIRNRKTSDIVLELTKYKTKKEFLNLPITRITTDGLEKTKVEISEAETSLEVITKTPNKELYLNDLLELKCTKFYK